MWTTRRLGTLILAGLLSGSCTETTSDEPVLPYRAQLKVFNDRVFNDRVFNDRIFNDRLFNDRIFNDRTFNDKLFNDKTFNDKLFNDKLFNDKLFNGFALNGVKVENISFEGSMLKGTVKGQPIQGAQFAGVTLEVNFTDPKIGSYKWKIEDVYLDADAVAKGFKDVWRYRITYWSSADPVWRSFCNDVEGNPADLIPLFGAYWDAKTGNRVDDPQSLTFACKDGALEKCVHIGYRPWASAQSCKGSGRSKQCSTVPLKDHHQACTRMLRADYCGNGTSYTETGTLLDIFDYLNPPVAQQEEKWQMEARWVPGGAICLSEERHPELGFPGYCMVNGKKTKLPSCQCYEDNRGLMVSTFNDDPKKGGKDKDKDK